MKKSYYAIIPANVRYDNELRPNAKLLYGEITALANEKGYCWATNSYFAELYEVKTETISRWISNLKKKGYIRTKLIYKEGSKEIEERRIYINNGPIDEIVNTPCENNQEPIDEIVNKGIDEKVKENNTVFNNTSNSNSSSNREIEQNENFKEITDLFQQNGFGLITQYTAEQLIELNKEYGLDWLKEAMQIAVKANSRNLRYVEGILKNWKSKGKGVRSDSYRTETEKADEDEYEYELPDHIFGD